MTVRNSTFYFNDANLFGGGIFNYGTLTLSNSTLSANAGTTGGGGINNAAPSTLNITNTIISDSSAGGDCVNNGTINTNTGNLIEDGSCSPAYSVDPGLTPLAFHGGFTKTMMPDSGSPVIDNGDNGSCESTDQRGASRPTGTQCEIGAFEVPPTNQPVNSSTDPGDRICDASECTLREAISVAAKGDTITFDPSLAGTTIALGSTIVVDKDLDIDGSALSSPISISGEDSQQVFYLSNVAGDLTAYFTSLDIIQGSSPQKGGGMFIPALSTVDIDSCNFSDNDAEDGGAIYSRGTLTIADSYFVENYASNDGGGIYDYYGDTTISGSTFDANDADNDGGALHNYGENMTITNSTISGNSSGSYGGGIYNFYGVLMLSNSTLAENGAISGGAGIANMGTSSTINMSNSILAGTGITEDCYNSSIMGTNIHNLIEDGTCSPALSGDPGLIPLADNGGPTFTHAITKDSLAFDAGDETTCESFDQRGVTRPQSTLCDIGAFELEVPEIDVLGNGQSIISADSTPSSADHTDFGSVFLGLNPITRIYTIENSGDGVLNLTGNPYVQITGPHASDFSVTSQPSTPIASKGGSITFTVSFDPSGAGLRTARISIANNDPDENPYTFAIQGTGTDGTFSDVTSAHWAFKYVEAIADAGLTSGYPDGTYRPENPVTRAEMAVFLLNGMGVTAPPINGSHPFTDIAGHWAESYIEELFDQGITGGYPDGTYRPENLVTRAEMAVFLLKGIGVTPPAMDGSHPFTDVAGHWAEIFIEELFDQGITGGYPDGTYRPENQVTRAEMAVFLVNAFNIPLP